MSDPINKLDQSLTALLTSDPRTDGNDTRVAFYLLERHFHDAVENMGKIVPTPWERTCLKQLVLDVERAQRETKGSDSTSLSRALDIFVAFLHSWQDGLSKELKALLTGGIQVGNSVLQAYSEVPQKPGAQRFRSANAILKGAVRATDGAYGTAMWQRSIRGGLLEQLEESRAAIRAQAVAAAVFSNDSEIPFSDDLEHIRQLCAARKARAGGLLKALTELPATLVPLPITVVLLPLRLLSAARKTYPADGGPDDLLKARAERQPRNPLATFDDSRADYEIGTEQSLLLADARRYARAALQLPQHAIYDKYRWPLVFRAGSKGLGAVRPHGTMDVRTCRPELAPDLSNLLEVALNSNVLSKEERAYGQWRSGLLLAMRGDPRAAYSRITEAKDSLAANWAYAENVACIAAAGGYFDDSLAWVKRAFSLGYDPRAMREAPEVAALIEARQSEFDALCTVQCRVGVKQRTFSRCLVVQNRSAFTLTNVVVTCAPGLDSSAPTTRFSYRWPSIAPAGQSGCVVETPTRSVRDWEITDIPFELTCDQGAAAR